MHDKSSTHISIVLITTLATTGLVIKSIFSGWEIWMAPVLILGMVIMWYLHISQHTTVKIREFYYTGFAMLGGFYYSVHQTSLFDVFVIMSIVMLTMALLNNVLILNFILTEYIVVMVMQLLLISDFQLAIIDSGNLGRLFFHVIAMLVIYALCRRKINENSRLSKEIENREKIIEDADSDNEDFLTNISHELRTPVNVVNGMTALILKKEEKEDIRSINNAGLRLSRQIEDIQDYTEIRRKQLSLEEDRYMITSLVNDVISTVRVREKEKDLEFVVDLDPAVPSVMLGDVKKLHKIIRHLLDNAIKFTKRGGVCVRLSVNKRDYGVNFIIEVSDTGIGMSESVIENASKGLYQANKKRNRSTGGIGLGLNIVYGFAHRMGGFVAIESEGGVGTTVRVSIPQKVLDGTNCLSIDNKNNRIGTVLFHVNPGKFAVPRVRDFYRELGITLASGLSFSLYSVSDAGEVRSAIEDMKVTHIFMGEEEYEAGPDYFDSLAAKGISVSVCVSKNFKAHTGKGVIILPKPLYGYPILKVLNGITEVSDINGAEKEEKMNLSGIRALIVDDEPMNLVVAEGLFRDYDMETDTAESGRAAIAKFENSDFDIIFMDHMMPEMDGVEAMKRMRDIASEKGKNPLFVALTANAVSGAKDMFLSEGFDGFISKPIDIDDFERVMKRLFQRNDVAENGGEK